MANFKNQLCKLISSIDVILWKICHVIEYYFQQLVQLYVVFMDVNFLLTIVLDYCTLKKNCYHFSIYLTQKVNIIYCLKYTIYIHKKIIKIITLFIGQDKIMVMTPTLLQIYDFNLENEQKTAPPVVYPQPIGYRQYKLISISEENTNNFSRYTAFSLSNSTIKICDLSNGYNFLDLYNSNE